MSRQLSQTLAKLNLALRLVYTYRQYRHFFASGSFDLFDVMCKQHHVTALNAFLNGTTNDDIDSTYKRNLSSNKTPCHPPLLAVLSSSVVSTRILDLQELTHHPLSQHYTSINVPCHPALLATVSSSVKASGIQW